MKKDFLLLLLLTLPAFAWLLQTGFFPVHDDLQAMRQLEMNKCFSDLQIPCRWVPDMGYGFGFPLFNYYPPLPYLLGQPFRWIGVQYIDIVKIVGVLGFVFTSWTMYFLGREFFGRRGGLISSIFYSYAPYHAVDYWVRGAVNEFYAMGFYPAILLGLYLLIKTGRKKYLLASALSIAGLMLSHNLMLLIFAPVGFIWCLFWVWKLKPKIFPAFLNLILAGLWSLGLAAFFTLPVIFEQKYAHLETLTMGYFNFLAHFLNIRQIFFIPNWGYGSSELGPDGMSFFLGYLHWLVPGILLILTFFNRKLRQYRSLVILLLLFTLASLLLTHNKTTPLWNLITPLQMLQFPWRFLTISVFCLSFISGAIAKILKKTWVFSLLIVLLILLNGNYFRPRDWYPDMTDTQKFSGRSWQLLITSGIFDYLPIFAPAPPGDAAGSDINLVNGSGSFRRLVKKSNYQKYSLEVSSPGLTAELQTFYFPGWRAFVDGREQRIDPYREKLLGRIQVDVPQGAHLLELRFTNTPIRFVGNILSLFAWLAVVFCLFRYFRFNRRMKLVV